MQIQEIGKKYFIGDQNGVKCSRVVFGKEIPNGFV